MRKFLISIISIFIGFSVFAAGENVTTSKSYVDSILVPKQDIIEGTNDSPRVLTNTGTAGEYGTKDIYDSTDTYSGQIDALVDAQTMNTAVQNAIDSEFQCVEYNPNDPTDCWLMDIRGTTEIQSPNLFNKDDPRIIMGRWISFNSNMIGLNFNSVARHISSGECISEPIIVHPNTTYTISNHKNANQSMANPSFLYLDENFIVVGGFQNLDRKVITFTVPNNNDIKYIILPCHVLQLNVMQFERGTVATPYQPYGNIYMPAGN